MGLLVEYSSLRQVWMPVNFRYIHREDEEVRGHEGQVLERS